MTLLPLLLIGVVVWAVLFTYGRRKREASPGSSAKDLRPGALGREPGDATRYLCAATYTDPSFARTVVTDLLGDPYGAVAASPGVDLEPVVLHALAARQVHRRRDLRLTAVFAVILVLAPLALVLNAVILAMAAGTAAGKRAVAGDRGGAGSAGRPGLWRAGAVLLVLAVVVLTMVLSPPGEGQWLLGTYLGGLPLVLCVVAGVPVVLLLVVRHVLEVDTVLRGKLRRQVFLPQNAPKAPPRTAWLAKRLDVIHQAQHGNATVYSGWNPARGFAAERSNWSLAVPTLPATPQNGEPPTPVVPFDAWELLTHLRERLSALPALDGDPQSPATLGGLVVEDRVFVHGATIGEDRRFLPSPVAPPLAALPPADVRRIALRPTTAARHCLVAYLPLWGGDVVPGVLLHVTTTERTVQVRCDTHVLPPVRGRYHDVDHTPATMTEDHRDHLLLRALADAAGTLWAAPLRALEHALFDKRREDRERRERRAIARNPEFDYGARTSVREAAVNSHYLNYFQVLDAERVLRALNRHTLSAIQDFLEAHGVDTTEFQGQQLSILNYGIIQQGGTSIVGNQAVGEGASATTFAGGGKPPTGPGGAMPTAPGPAKKAP
ncbi:hypothetical protein ACFV3R_31980 [Streptomyces sp. NPDC059740]|uniref:hypothetical protein n=1 Tax=Streptomyces sp. NPDC059740 TaxID=3346926 RepID=UPI0036604880